MGNCISRTSRSSPLFNTEKTPKPERTELGGGSPRLVSNPLLSGLTETRSSEDNTQGARGGIRHTSAGVERTGPDLLSSLPDELKQKITSEFRKTRDLSAWLALGATSMTWKRFIFENPFEYGLLREADAAIRDAGDLQATGGKWLPFMRPDERAKFIDEAIENYRQGNGSYLGMLGRHMALLSADQLDRIIDVVKSVHGGLYENVAKLALISVVENRTDDQRAAIFDHAVKSISEPSSVEAVAAQMEHWSPGQRDRLFDAAYAGMAGGEDPPNPSERRNLLYALKPGAANLSEDQCTKALKLFFNDELDVNAPLVDPIRGASLAARMTKLTDGERERIVSICIELARAGNPGALAALEPGLERFSADQRERLLNSAVSIRNRRLRINTMTRFAAGMPHWTDRQRKEIFEAILGKPDHGVDKIAVDDVTLRGLIAIAARAESLTDEQQKHLIRIAVKDPEALRKIWPHMAHFSEGNRKLLANGADAVESWGEDELSNVAPIVQYVSDATRSKIVSAIEMLPEGRRAVIVPTFRPALAHFSVKQRQRILAAASAIQHRWWRANALGGLVIEPPLDRFAKAEIAALA